MTLRFRARARGPLVVSVPAGPDGAPLPVEVLRPDGSAIDVAGRAQLLFCRCGRTRSAPLCDGAHNGCDFEKPE